MIIPKLMTNGIICTALHVTVFGFRYSPCEREVKVIESMKKEEGPLTGQILSFLVCDGFPENICFIIFGSFHYSMFHFYSGFVTYKCGCYQFCYYFVYNILDDTNFIIIFYVIIWYHPMLSFWSYNLCYQFCYPFHYHFPLF
jgi:hypothetical protein